MYFFVQTNYQWIREDNNNRQIRIKYNNTIIYNIIIHNTI